jgi:hypothetical protein
MAKKSVTMTPGGDGRREKEIQSGRAGDEPSRRSVTGAAQPATPMSPLRAPRRVARSWRSRKKTTKARQASRTTCSHKGGGQQEVVRGARHPRSAPPIPLPPASCAVSRTPTSPPHRQHGVEQLVAPEAGDAHCHSDPACVSGLLQLGVRVGGSEGRQRTMRRLSNCDGAAVSCAVERRCRRCSQSAGCLQHAPARWWAPASSRAGGRRCCW